MAQTQPQSEQPDVRDLMHRAATLHLHGQLSEAERLYLEILTKRPNYFDALHLLGVLKHQNGETVEALRLIGRALSTNDRTASAHSNYGTVLAALARHEEALESYERALALRPEFAEALHNRGNALNALGRAEEALASFDRALALKPEYFDALINRAQLLHALGRDKEALADSQRALAVRPDHVAALTMRGRVERRLFGHEMALESFDRALMLKRDDADALTARGNTYYAMKSYAAALTDYNRALLARPDAAPLHNNRGNVLRDVGRHQEALVSFDRAIELDPNYAEAYSNRANAYLELNRMAAALAGYDRALQLKPDFAYAMVNRGNALRYLSRFDEAIASFDRALALEPELAEAHWNKGLLLLSRGDFENGLPEYEWRWRRDDEFKPRDFTQPQWRGEDLAGKTVLLHAEQGFGDSIQFLRYVPLVVAKGARVVLELPDSLIPLVGRFEGVIAMVSRGQRLPDFDLHCPLLSLPLAFGTTLSTIPPFAPYLLAPAERMTKWRVLIPRTGRPRVGLVWSGKPSHKNDRNRSIAFVRLSPLLARAGIDFVSLQREYRESDRASLATFPNLLRLDAALSDFADTAAVIETLDLVITVDTAVAHLAAAMGKPVWILLSAVLDWRWLLEREDSPWYPTARLFRQIEIGRWDSVINRVMIELGSYFADRLPVPDSSLKKSASRSSPPRKRALPKLVGRDA
jgi:tetratricopeptide (TPR) repeat protein